MRSSPRNNRARRRGLSIAEVMISLTISSFLLVAVAAAYSASADAVEMNDKFFRATQAGRVTMNQLLTEIRRADYILVAPTKDSIIVTRPQVNRINAEEKSREYKYDPNTRKITLQIFFERPDKTVYSSPAYSLASNVEWAEFATPDRIQDVTGQWLDVRVPVTIDVKIGTNSVRLSGSSSPRRVAQG